MIVCGGWKCKTEKSSCIKFILYNFILSHTDYFKYQNAFRVKEKLQPVKESRVDEDDEVISPLLPLSFSTPPGSDRTLLLSVLLQRRRPPPAHRSPWWGPTQRVPRGRNSWGWRRAWRRPRSFYLLSATSAETDRWGRRRQTGKRVSIFSLTETETAHSSYFKRFPVASEATVKPVNPV